jgi:hypothetical protein
LPSLLDAIDDQCASPVAVYLFQQAPVLTAELAIGFAMAVSRLATSATIMPIALYDLEVFRFIGLLALVLLSSGILTRFSKCA